MRKLTLVAASVLSLAMASGCGSDDLSGPEVQPQAAFRARLEGASVMPPVVSNAGGAAYLEFQTAVTEPGADSRVFYSLQISGVSGTSQILLRHGATGQNGEVLYTLCGPTAVRACQAGPRLEMAGIVEAAELRGFPAEMSQLRQMVEAGQTYVEVQTKAHLAGELRGQLRP